MAGRAFKLEWADLSGGPDDSIVQDPTPGDIDAILDVLAGAEDGFVILSAGNQTFIQAAAADDAGAPLTIEHRAGSAKSHFAIDESVFDATRLKALFRAFHANPGSISAAARWRKMDA